MDKEGIKRLFELACVGVTNEELARFQNEFKAILEYAAKLKEAPLGDLPPTLSMAPRTNVSREDRSVPVQDESLELLISQFPESKEKYLKTKNVFKK